MQALCVLYWLTFLQQICGLFGSVWPRNPRFVAWHEIAETVSATTLQFHCRTLSASLLEKQAWQEELWSGWLWGWLLPTMCEIDVGDVADTMIPVCRCADIPDVYFCGIVVYFLCPVWRFWCIHHAYACKTVHHVFVSLSVTLLHRVKTAKHTLGICLPASSRTFSFFQNIAPVYNFDGTTSDMTLNTDESKNLKIYRASRHAWLTAL